MPRDRSDVVRQLQRKGFSLKQGNRDHDFLFYVREGLTQAIFTKVSRGSSYRVINDALLSRMARQVRLTNPQLMDLLDCPMSQEDYEAHLVDVGVLRTRSR